MYRIFYLIPDVPKAKFQLRAFLRSIKNCEVIKYLKPIFFPDWNHASGGTKILLQHVQLLNKNGFEAHPLKMGRFEGNAFGFDLTYIEKDQALLTIDENDIVVSTEFFPYDGLNFPRTRKILFAQSWIFLTSQLRPEDKNKTYHDIGYEDVITCSQYVTSEIRNQMDIESHIIRNSIDQSAFKANPKKRKTNRVLVFSRKNYHDFLKIKDYFDDKNIDFKIVDGLTQSELIEEYQSADIFLATGYPEGFGLPPLEAMSCGCVVVGFTGGGALEYMKHEETALIADDGDCETAAKHLKRILSDAPLKENLRAAGQKIAKEYSLENMEASLVNYYQKLLSKNVSNHY